MHIKFRATAVKWCKIRQHHYWIKNEKEREKIKKIYSSYFPCRQNATYKFLNDELKIFDSLQRYRLASVMTRWWLLVIHNIFIYNMHAFWRFAPKIYLTDCSEFSYFIRWHRSFHKFFLWNFDMNSTSDSISNRCLFHLWIICTF